MNEPPGGYEPDSILCFPGCGQETACSYYDGERKVRLCPECLERMRREPTAREVLLAEGPSLAN